MKSLRSAPALLALPGLALGLVSVLVVLSSDHAGDARVGAVVFTPLIGFSFLGTGLYAWWRRPDNGTGPLMAAIGFTWFLSALDASERALPFAIGSVLAALPFALFLHMLIAFPSGRLVNRTERVLAGVGYFDTTVVQVAALLFFQTGGADGCESCPVNPILVSDQPDVAAAIFAAQAVIAFCGVAGIAFVLIRRWRSAAAGYRRALGPVLVMGGVSAGMLLASLLGDFTSFPDGAAEDVVDVLSAATMAAVPFAFLAGLMRTRLSGAAAVSELVRRLGEVDRRAGIRDALANALGDPSLSLVYWVPELGVYADADGTPVDTDGATGGQTDTRVSHDGSPVAIIRHDPDLQAEDGLVETVGAAASLALANERLEVALRARLEELRASRARIVKAGDAERARLERDLHDGAQHSLVLLALTLERASLSLGDDRGSAHELISAAKEQLAEATTELRELARGLHPSILTGRGLGPALGMLADRATVRVDLDLRLGERSPAPVEAAAYFVVAEALTNVARYADGARASVRAERTESDLVVEVVDDGPGGADPSSGSGLRGLDDRVSALGGQMTVSSERGEGTRVRAVLPVR